VKAMETRQQTSFRAFIKRHAVLTYFTLVFALSWGLPLIIVLISPVPSWGPAPRHPLQTT
jgi:hypothetical protein